MVWYSRIISLDASSSNPAASCVHVTEGSKQTTRYMPNNVILVLPAAWIVRRRGAVEEDGRAGTHHVTEVGRPVQGGVSWGCAGGGVVGGAVDVRRNSGKLGDEVEAVLQHWLPVLALMQPLAVRLGEHAGRLRTGGPPGFPLTHRSPPWSHIAGHDSCSPDTTRQGSPQERRNGLLSSEMRRAGGQTFGRAWMRQNQAAV